MVNYEILYGNYENLFQVDKQSGKISLKERSSQQAKRMLLGESEIILTVRAYDLGIPQLSSITKVIIHVKVIVLIGDKVKYILKFFFCILILIRTL